MRMFRHVIFGAGVITLFVVPWVLLSIVLTQGGRLPWTSPTIPVSATSGEIPELVLEVTVPSVNHYMTVPTDRGIAIHSQTPQSIRIVINFDGDAAADQNKVKTARASD